jgi:iron complex transport system permease protein
VTATSARSPLAAPPEVRGLRGSALRMPRTENPVRIDARTVTVSLALAAVAVLAFAVGISVGDFPIPLQDVFPAMIGQGNPDSDFIVRTLRMPRALTGLLVGLAFGLSGAVFQWLARNPLASPDIIGITAGASAAAVFVIVSATATTAVVSFGALGGALVTAVAIYVLAYRRGVSGYRLVLVGIGVGAVLTSITSYLLTRADITDAQRATVWLTGSLNGRGWDHVVPVGLALAVLVPVTLAMTARLRALQLGDDVARGLGVPVEVSRLVLILAAVALAAVATASAGPIGFVALVAPQLARRLVGGGSVALLPSALMGACLVLVSDIVARRALAPTEFPVGIVTAIIGAPYLLWLLARANRVGRAG